MFQRTETFFMKYGARGGTRTPTPVKEPDPKSGASTNFATRAHEFVYQLRYIYNTTDNYKRKKKI